MESDDELSEDTEEILVYVEFEGFAGSGSFNATQLQLDVIGIDTEHPIIQLNGRFYEGTYEDAAGTYMFFEKDNCPIVDDYTFDTIPTQKYFAKTRKVLKMQRIFTKSRTEVLGDSEHVKCIPNMDTLAQAGVPPTCQKEALSFWQTIRNSRMDALCAYMERQKDREEKRSKGIVMESESDEESPFAFYKQGEGTKALCKSDGTIVDCEKSNVEESKTIDNLIGDIKKSPTKNTDVAKIKDGVQKDNVENSILRQSSQDSVVDTKMIQKPARVMHKKKKCIIRRIQNKKKKQRDTTTDENLLISEEEANSSVKVVPKLLEEMESVSSLSIPDIVDTISCTTDNNSSSKNKTNLSAESHELNIDNVALTNKRLEKQLKRQEKMEEISRRLKAAAEEYLKMKVE
ncbi:hypothetical protein KM043_001588 [Ampulex compressa]|nr:hypothetical protein KM043_001588 [Ampulex compressa]